MKADAPGGAPSGQPGYLALCPRPPRLTFPGFGTR
jgi:hypothetical protein